MKKLVSVFILLMAVVLFAPGCMAEGVSITKEKAVLAPVEETGKSDTMTGATLNANETVNNLTATIGDTILISLSENPTTGFSWNITNSTGLELLGDEYYLEKVKEGIVGAGGVHKWMVRVVESGNQMVTGVYKRPWEPDTGEEEKYILNVIVG